MNLYTAEKIAQQRQHELVREAELHHQLKGMTDSAMPRTSIRTYIGSLLNSVGQGLKLRLRPGDIHQS